MILTKEQQEAILEKYAKDNHNTDECIGFVDGINATIELINKLTIPVIANRTFKCNRCGGKYELLVGELGGCCTSEVEDRTSGICGGELIEITN